ncbi:MAG: GNAT family N-acetyltransferase [Parcubacteria group bacterium]
MPEPIAVKKLKRRELPELLLIAKVYYPLDPWLTLEYLQALEHRAVVAYSIRWSGRLVGGMMITADKHPNYWIDFMVIDRNVSRRGLGESLFVSAERHLASGRMLWHLVPDNKTFTPSKKFLSKMGLEERGSLRGWFGRTNALAYAKRVR